MVKKVFGSLIIAMIVATISSTNNIQYCKKTIQGVHKLDDYGTKSFGNENSMKLLNALALNFFYCGELSKQLMDRIGENGANECMKSICSLRTRIEHMAAEQEKKGAVVLVRSSMKHNTFGDVSKTTLEDCKKFL